MVKIKCGKEKALSLIRMSNLKRVAWNITRKFTGTRYAQSKSRVHLVRETADDTKRQKTLCGRKVPFWRYQPEDDKLCKSCQRFAPDVDWQKLGWY